MIFGRNRGSAQMPKTKECEIVIKASFRIPRGKVAHSVVLGENVDKRCSPRAYIAAHWKFHDLSGRPHLWFAEMFVK